MDILQGFDFIKLGAYGVMAFGAVYITSQFKEDLSAKQKIGLHFIYFIIFSFIPAEIANVIFQKIKDAVAGTLLVIGFYQAGKGITKPQPIEPKQ